MLLDRFITAAQQLRSLLDRDAIFMRRQGGPSLHCKRRGSTVRDNVRIRAWLLVLPSGGEAGGRGGDPIAGRRQAAGRPFAVVSQGGGGAAEFASGFVRK